MDSFVWLASFTVTKSCTVQPENCQPNFEDIAVTEVQASFQKTLSNLVKTNTDKTNNSLERTFAGQTVGQACTYSLEEKYGFDELLF